MRMQQLFEQALHAELCWWLSLLDFYANLYVFQSPRSKPQGRNSPLPPPPPDTQEVYEVMESGDFPAPPPPIDVSFLVQSLLFLLVCVFVCCLFFFLLVCLFVICLFVCYFSCVLHDRWRCGFILCTAYGITPTTFRIINKWMLPHLSAVEPYALYSQTLSTWV